MDDKKPNTLGGLFDCPFDGQQSTLFYYWYPGLTEVSIGCQACGARGPRAETREEATAKWNERIGRHASESVDEVAWLKGEAKGLHIEVDIIMRSFSGLGLELFNALRSIERSLLAMYDEKERPRALADSKGTEGEER